MRRRIWTLLVLAAALLTLAACGKDAAEEAAGGDWRTWQPVQAQAQLTRGGQTLDALLCVYDDGAVLYLDDAVQTNVGTLSFPAQMEGAGERFLSGDFADLDSDGNSDAALRFTQEDGSVNVIEISERGAVMASSTCHNQLCVQMGEVTLDNWETRPNQQFIICLPNRVSVELVVKE